MPRLLWKILLSTSLALTALFAVTGWIIQDHVQRMVTSSLEEEVQASFQAYESLWEARADKLSSVSLVLSRMSDVRAAFGTGDAATIRDTAGELWSKISHHDAVFAVADPAGRLIACLGGLCTALHSQMPEVEAAATRFPAQASGLLVENGRLFQMAVTPVYVDSPRGATLLNVLVAGYLVGPELANELKQATGGSDFVFRAKGAKVASTLEPEAKEENYSALATPLRDVTGEVIGELRILRSLESAKRRVNALRRDIVLIWLGALLLGIALTWWLARKILEPVRALDRAASEIGAGNYDAEVTVDSQDELGRLAKTFNGMCASIRSAREELIQKEQIATIGRLSTSIVHDLRNPLASIYGGAEMLVDDELTPAQIKRVASNIYRSSRRMQEMLQELVDVTRGHAHAVEPCRVREVIEAAIEPLRNAAASRHIEVTCDVPDNAEIAVERSRVERVFGNIVSNAIEAMPGGGAIRVNAVREDGSMLIVVRDTGPGISPEIAGKLFQPFVSAGKKNGLGLGLALSRQTVLDHGGRLWVESKPGEGAAFFVQFPV